MNTRGVFALLCALVTVGCGSRRPVTAKEISHEDWTAARARLAQLRSSRHERPYVVQLRVGMREPRTGKIFEARGALAVAPHDAMRMILVGPAGHTALDVWVTRERWRFVVPAAGFKRTGGADPAAARGLPVNFFRWWFLSPLDGRLLSAAMGRGGPTFLLRDATGTVIVHATEGTTQMSLAALRREAGTVQALEWTGRDLSPHAGDHARYVEQGSGLQVEVRVDDVSQEEPDPAAFLDPDDPGVAL